MPLLLPPSVAPHLNFGWKEIDSIGKPIFTSVSVAFFRMAVLEIPKELHIGSSVFSKRLKPGIRWWNLEDESYRFRSEAC